MKNLKRFWNRFGFYLSLAAFLSLVAWGASALRAPARPEAPAPAPAAAETPRAVESLSKAREPLFSSPLPAGEIRGAYSALPVWSESLGLWQTHEAIDIFAEAGEAVVAARDGCVSEVWIDPVMGFSVLISHGDGLTSAYQCLSAMPPVEKGQELRRGDLVGSVGTSAVAEEGAGPHLHFETCRDGAPFCPAFDDGPAGQSSESRPTR